MLNTELEPLDTTAQTVQVVIAVIINKDKQVLISKRAEQVHQGGYWEFPGGKKSQGESDEQALKREILEELGAQVDSLNALIQFEYHYPDKHIFFSVYKVTIVETRRYKLINVNTIGASYQSSLSEQGLEGQQVRWVPFEQLTQYSFPPANKAILNALFLPKSYLITPELSEKAIADNDWSEFQAQFTRSCKSQKLIQLRIKSLETSLLAELMTDLFALAGKNSIKLLLNSSMNITDEMIQHSAGLHLTSQHLFDELWINNFKKQFPDKILAASCHDVDDIQQANHFCLDFIVISAVKQTLSHPEQPALGWEKFKKLARYAQMPVYALGGMQLSDIQCAQLSGAHGIAAIRSLWASEFKPIKE